MLVRGNQRLARMVDGKQSFVRTMRHNRPGAACHYFGGELVSAKTADGWPHYWNRIKGMECDLTKKQFGRKRPAMTKVNFIENKIALGVIKTLRLKCHKSGPIYDLSRRFNLFMEKIKKEMEK